MEYFLCDFGVTQLENLNCLFEFMC